MVDFDVILGQLHRQTLQIHSHNAPPDILLNYCHQLPNTLAYFPLSNLIIKNAMLLNNVIEVFAPLFQWGDPSVKLQAILVVDIFKGQEVLYFLFDYFKDGGEEGAFLGEDGFEFEVVGLGLGTVCELVVVLLEEGEEVAQESVQGLLEDLVQ